MEKVHGEKRLPAAIAAFVIHQDDNVATLLDDAQADVAVPIRGESNLPDVRTRDAIHEGHKVAIMDIPQGDPVTKYGAAIGTAAVPIRSGDWVHLHNCRSRLDERSGTLDLETGASTDVRYE